MVFDANGVLQMYHELFADATFWAFLFSIDQDLANASREKRCPACGGTLHCVVKVSI